MAYRLHTDVRAKSMCSAGSRALSRVKYTVFHYTGNETDTACANAKFFRDGVERKAGAHFFIDDKDAYMSISLDLIANAVGGSRYSDCDKTGGGTLHGVVTNKNSWSIEMCSQHGSFTGQTLYNAALLHVAICKHFGFPLDNVCRHFDVTGKLCPEYWVYGNDWDKFKGLLKSVEQSFVPNGLQNVQDYDGNWYYLDKFGSMTDYTGLAKNKNGWFYVRNGKVDFSFSGFVQNDQGWWYVDNGKVDFKHTGLFYDKTYGWWYVQKSQINKQYTGLVENEKGWWLVEGGKVRFGYTGLYHDKTYGWWYIEKSKVNKNFTGLVQNDQGWWLVDKGTIRFNYTGLFNDKIYGWWYLEKSKVNKNFTGLYNDTKCGWWYIKDGHIKFDRTLVARNQYGAWYVKDNKVMLNYTGQATIGGEVYSVAKGKIE